MSASEIRNSTISKLLQKASDRNYGQYLAKLVIKRIRGFQSESIAFDFPVTALIGPNGGGKTTILGAAGCAYKSVQPKRFFSKSGKYDETMQDWSIEYELVERALNQRESIRRTASFRDQRWNREAPERKVLIFGVARTVPVTERTELRRCASTTFSIPDGQVEDFAAPVRQSVSRILGKDVSGFQRLRINKDGRITLLTGRTNDGRRYSEFHFGAGESSVMRMVAEIERAEDQSLILIEEIENGLHPVATVRMVEYLIDAADRKRLQAIFTTHSNDALQPLPSKAIWVATQDRIFQGKLDIHSLRAITGQIEAKLVIFVEDKFSKTWVEAILRQVGAIAVDHVQVHAMQGDGMAVKVNRNHNVDPSSGVPSVCFIDGDSQQPESKDERVFSLPGGAPEALVYDQVMAAWGEYGGKLSVALLQKFEASDKVKAVCEATRLTNHDPHLLFAQVGEKLALIPEATAAAAFANLWAQAYPEATASILAPIRDLLPTETLD